MVCMGRPGSSHASHVACGRFIAFTEVDESEIPPYRIMHLGKAAVGECAQVRRRNCAGAHWPKA